MYFCCCCCVVGYDLKFFGLLDRNERKKKEEKENVIYELYLNLFLETNYMLRGRNSNYAPSGRPIFVMMGAGLL